MYSIIIPLYNKEKEIKKTLDSVFNQTFQEFEIIIVNDGSSDKGVEIVKGYNDSRIRIINQINQGVSVARNNGVLEANYDWIVFLDADDLWSPFHLDTFVKGMEEEKNELVFCNSYVRKEIKFNKEATIPSFVVIDNYFKEVLKQGHFFWTSVVCIHKTVFEKIGLFRTYLSRGEDLDLWVRIGANYNIVKSDIITSIYVQEASNKLTKTKEDFNKSILNHINFSSLKDDEKKYYSYLIKQKFKNSLRKQDWRLIFKLIRKYHIYVFI